jgi:hypothetical protein
LGAKVQKDCQLKSLEPLPILLKLPLQIPVTRIAFYIASLDIIIVRLAINISRFDINMRRLAKYNNCLSAGVYAATFRRMSKKLF